jgi:histidine triad (HIT) family protein
MRLARLIRSPAGRAIVGQVFACMSFALPVHRLRETSTLLAFNHPRPSYRVHILLVPKKALAGLASLTPADSDFLIDLFSTVQSLVEEYHLEPAGYRLIANGGEYQDFPQLHFHLVSGPPASNPIPLA